MWDLFKKECVCRGPPFPESAPSQEVLYERITFTLRFGTLSLYMQTENTQPKTTRRMVQRSPCKQVNRLQCMSSEEVIPYTTEIVSSPLIVLPYSCVQFTLYKAIDCMHSASHSTTEATTNQERRSKQKGSTLKWQISASFVLYW